MPSTLKGHKSKLDLILELLRSSGGVYPFPWHLGVPESKVSLAELRQGLGNSALSPLLRPEQTMPLPHDLGSEKRKVVWPSQASLPGARVGGVRAGHSWHSNPPRIPAGAKSLVSGEMTSELWTWLAGHCLDLKVPGRHLSPYLVLPLPHAMGSRGFGKQNGLLE